MKSLKPLFLVLAGMLITVALFSFKSDEPKKEYATMLFGIRNTLSYGIDRTEELQFGKDRQAAITEQFNKMAKEGWTIKCTEGAMTIFERTKQ
jgi:hypothetical protein